MSTPTDADKAKVARGETPVWEGTFKHALHGELRFSAPLPKAVALAEQTIETDNLLANLDGPPREATMILVAAMAGFKTLLDLPVIEERREEDEETGKVTVERVYYDVDDELDVAFPVTVWRDFSEWRQGFIDGLDDLKKGLGETRGSGSSEPSSDRSGSPSTTPA